ncbi:MAG: hypothetical protein ACI85Q_001343 [Salibacteraceae bacterium]|jgi:hypothetical protein
MNIYKLTLVTLLLFAFGLLGFQSCNQTEDEIIAGITPVMSASIGGNSWSTNIAGGITSTIIVVTGTKDREAVVLTLPSKDPGTYPIDFISTNATYSPMIDSLAAAFVAFEGEVIITSINTLRTQIQGTYNFKAANAASLDTVHVTNGILRNIPIK